MIVLETESQIANMLKRPIDKLFLSLVWPNVISMVIIAIYAFTDTFFVSKLGKSLSGAIGVAYPLVFIIQTLGFTLGMGCSSLIGVKIGKDDKEGANILVSQTFFLSLFLGLIFAVIGLLFLKPIMYLMGASESNVAFALSYAKYIFLSAPFMVGTIVLSNILRSVGKTLYSMIGLVLGGLLNALLDPLLIFTFKLSIAGAALSTLISQIVSFFLLLFLFFFKQNSIKIQFKMITYNLKNYLEICKAGSSSFFRQIFVSIGAIALNHQLSIIGGDVALASFSIVSKIVMLIFSFVLGVLQTLHAVAGCNFFAKMYVRVKSVFKLSLFVVFLILMISSIFTYIFAPSIVGVFLKGENEVITLGVKSLKYQCLTMPLLFINLVCATMYQAMCKKIKAIILSIYRQGIFYIPLVFLLPHFFKLKGIIVLQPLCDILTFLFTIPFFISLLLKLKRVNI